jgi:hypothetical protein
MKIWHVVKDNEVIDSLIADPKGQVEAIYPDHEIIEDDGIIGVGWIRIDDSWRLPEPEDDRTWEWNDELKRWIFVPSPEELSIIEE